MTKHAHAEDRGLAEADLSAALGPFGSDQSVLCVLAVILSKLCPAPLPPIPTLNLK